MSDARIEAYSRALFEVAQAEGNLAIVEDELFRMARAVPQRFKKNLTVRLLLGRSQSLMLQVFARHSVISRLSDAKFWQKPKHRRQQFLLMVVFELLKRLLNSRQKQLPILQQPVVVAAKNFAEKLPDCLVRQYLLQLQQASTIALNKI